LVARGTKLAFVFPGQGSQRAGMAADLLAQEQAAREVFARAGEITGLDLAALCTTGDAGALTRTEIAQPALLTMAVAWLHALAARGLRPDLVAGHSLGEFAAWVAAGVLSLDDALALVQRRGELMEEAGRQRPGAMAAVIGLPAEQVVDLCRQAQSAGVVVVANYNSPEQTVVSGDAAAVAEVARLTVPAGGRALPLRVSGAFHSPLMEEAGRRFAALVAEAPLAAPAIPVVANYSAGLASTAEQARQAMARQMPSPVRWTDSMRRMAEEGTDRFLEVGPGQVLTRLVARILPDVRTRAVGAAGEVGATVEEMST
jgi:[acyl-carrier-protein] S-malonyltransferase